MQIDIFDDNLSIQFKEIVKKINELEFAEKVKKINELRFLIHEISPFKTEPVDYVEWVSNDKVYANDYNPNSVAPPEMELLKVSIEADGYTQPIVSMPNDGKFEVVDGFHRHRVGKEIAEITNRVHGYLPLVKIRPSQEDKTNRMAATIRHNRARGEHKVDSMSEIVIELKRRFWDDERIAKELGMDSDEVLRLQQVSGLAVAFADKDFSEAWEATSFEDL